MENIDKKIFQVYKHTNLINGKVYIGITKNNPNKRWGSNGINYKRNKHFYSAIRKYNWDNFKHEILFSNLTKEDACKKEIELINLYKSSNPMYGYNKSKGGEFGAYGTTRIQTLETKKKISDKINKSIICINNQTKYKSAREAGKILNLDYRYISRVLNGLAKHCHGYVFVFEKDFDKNKKYDLSINKIKIKCLETNEIFESITQCANKLGLNKANINHVLKGRRKSYHNLHFEYYNNDNILIYN